MSEFLLAAWVVGGAGAVLLYLSAPRQAMIAKALPRWTRLGAIALLAAAGVLFACVLSPATAIYSMIVLLMLVWSLFPLLVAMLRRRA